MGQCVLDYLAMAGKPLGAEHEVRRFIEDVLGIQYRYISEPCQEMLDYLNEIILAFHKIPFQNITYQALSVEQRTIPSVLESYEKVFSGEGGLCWTNNITMYYVLQCLGYNVFMNRASVAQRGTNNHVIIIACSVLTPTDLYLVDLGFGATFEAIPMDFKEESPTYKHSFITYKYIKQGNEYIRLHKKGNDFHQYPFSQGDWNFTYFFELLDERVDAMEEMMKVCYESPQFPFWTQLRAIYYKESKAIATKNGVILMEDEHNKLVAVAEYNSSQKEQYKNHLYTLFPMVSKTHISSAVDNYFVLGSNA